MRFFEAYIHAGILILEWRLLYVNAKRIFQDKEVSLLMTQQGLFSFPTTHRVKYLHLSLLLIGLVSISTLHAQSYPKLWQAVYQATQDDLPRSAINNIDKVAAKARSKGDKGQVVKAALVRAQITQGLSTDSLPQTLARLETLISQTDDVGVQAMMHLALAKCQEENYSLFSTQRDSLVRMHLNEVATRLPYLLHLRAKDYLPAVERQQDATIKKQPDLFHGDLLHAVAAEWLAAQPIRLYTSDSLYRHVMNIYTAAGNNDAAAYLHYQWLVQYARPHKASTTWAHWAEHYRNTQVAPLFWVAWAERNSWRHAHDKLQWAKTHYKKSPFISAIHNHIAQATAPAIALELPEIVSTTAGEARYTARCRNIKKLRLRLYHTPYTTLSNRPEKIGKSEALAAEWTLDVPRDSMADFVDAPLTFQWPTQPGLYRAVLTGDKLNTQHFVHITDLALLRINTPKHTRFVSVNRQSGVAIPHTTLTAYDRDGKQLWQDSTNSEGELLTDDTHEYHSIAISRGNDQAAPLIYTYHKPQRASYDETANNNSQRGTLSELPLQLHLNTDRSLYRPGQKLYVSGVVFRSNNDDATAVANIRVPISIRNAQMAVVHRDTITSDRFGTFVTTFTLPSTILAGALYIDTPHGTHECRVEAFKAPSYEVKLDSIVGSPKAGERIVLRGAALGFDGAPIVGAKISINLTTQPWPWWRNNNSEPYNTQAYATTDAEGVFTSEVTLAPSLEDDYFMRYKLTAEASSPTGEVQRSEYEFSINSHPRQLFAEWPKQVRQDKLPSITYHLLGSTGKPLHSQGTLDVYALNDSTSPIATQAFTAAHPFTPTLLSKLPQGQYRIVAHVAAQNELPEARHEITSITLFDPMAKQAAAPLVLYRSAPDEQLQTAEFIIGSNLPDATLYYTLASYDGKVERHERIALKGGYAHLPLTYTEAFGESATLHVAFHAQQGDSSYNTLSSIRVARPFIDKTLHYRWERFIDKVRPSDQAQWQLRLMDSEGKPVEANLMLSVSDASVNTLFDNYRPFQLNRWRHFTFISDTWALTTPTLHRYAASQYPTLYPTIAPLRYTLPLLSYELYRPTATRMVLRGMPTALAGALDNYAAEASIIAKEPMGAIKRASKALTVHTPINIPKLRSDFSPTAYYNGQLRTDKEGRASISFTLPHSATTWQVRGLATTADMCYVSFDTTLVARPDIAIRSNLPRFVYESDSVSFTATFLNTKTIPLDVRNTIEVRNADNGVVLNTQHWKGSLAANAQAETTISCRAPQGVSALKVRIWAEGKTYSDGEEYTIPIYQQKTTQVVRTALPLDKAGIHTLLLDTLEAPISGTLTSRQLTLTSNPAWLAVMSLPTMANARYHDAYTLANTLYAATLTQHIIQTQPHVARAINTWQELGNKLPQNLQHKAQLAGTTLNDTPWLSEANDATTQIKHLATFAKPNISRNAFDRALAELAQLQDEYGGFSWCQGMPTSPYITAQVALQLARMQYLTQRDVATYNYDQAMAYLYRTASQWYADYKAKRTADVPQWLTDYLYIYATTRRTFTKKQGELANHIMDIIQAKGIAIDLQQKAKVATILHHLGHKVAATKQLHSLQQHLVHKPGYGTYYDATNSSYNRNSIGTQVAALDALRTLGELTLENQEQMRLWLVQQRRAQQWPDAVATAEAVHTLLQGHDELVRPKVNTKSAKAAQEEANNKRQKDNSVPSDSIAKPATRLQLVNLDETTTPIYYTFAKGKQTLATNSGIRGSETNSLGYIETRFNASDIALQATTLKLQKTNNHFAYGTLYSSYALPLASTTAQATGLALSRRLEYWNGQTWQATETDSTSLATLQRFKPLRLRQVVTIVAKQTYSFVRIDAPRSAAAEPTQQLSGFSYQGGTPHYRSVGDAGTTYFVEHLTKGTHHFIEEWYISRTGEFQWPATQATCLFAPEFSGQTAGQWLRF